MTKQEKLEAALAKAEAALAKAVINAAKVDGNRADSDASIEKLRVYCRRLRAALVEWKHLEPAARSGETFDILIKELLEVSKRTARESPPSTQLSEHAVRGENKRSQEKARRRKPPHRLNIGFLTLERIRRNAFAARLLMRQAIGLSALAMAYLEYQYFDVQLQILSLRSIFPELHP